MTAGRIAPFGIIAACLLAGPGKADAASVDNPALSVLLEASDGPVKLVFRKDGLVPTFAAGALHSCTGLAENTSMKFLMAHGAAFGIGDPSLLVMDHVIDVGIGSVVRFHQELAGIPVEFGGITVRTDTSGRVRAVAADVVDLSEASTVPEIATVSAIVLARETASDLRMAHLTTPRSDLVFLPVAGGVRLAHRVRLGAVPAFLSNPVVYIDALDGSTLLVRNAIRFDKLADVYEENPIATPTIVTVTLTNLPDGSTNLTGSRALARNCPDLHETTHIEFMGIPLDIHTCSEVQQATADSSGDFIYTPEPMSAGDDFAEAMIYYAVERAYDHYRGLGFDLLDEVPLPATVNFRTPLNVYAPIDLAAITAATDPYGTLHPFENAMFVEAGNLFDILTRTEDSIIFGQGTMGDFAYDGDVVTHEFGHAVVAATCNLQSYSFDAFGLDASPGALNEAFADVGAFLDTADSVVGDYAGSWITGAGIRDVDVDNACPEALTGESHEDSLMFTGALWDIVQAFPSDADAIERAFFAAQIMLNSLSDFDEATAGIIAAIETSLGATAAATAATHFDAHNTAACERVVHLDWGYTHSNILHMVPGAMMASVNDPFVPGPLQFHVDATMYYEQLILTFRAQADQMSMFTGGEIAPAVVFKRGSDPIAFEYSGATVTGDWTLVKDAEETSAGYYEVRLWLDGEGIPADEYHFMIANTADSGLNAYQIRVLPTDDPYPRPDDEEPVAEEADAAEPVDDASTDAEDDGDGGGGKGCGCSLAS
ncbi:MAG: hypothetical protein JRG91_19935 [Deltaproteobacteria bacterium]|nr:hypothetical protein [Deltaproteobacteria bacterium]